MVSQEAVVLVPLASGTAPKSRPLEVAHVAKHGWMRRSRSAVEHFLTGSGPALQCDPVTVSTPHYQLIANATQENQRQQRWTHRRAVFQSQRKRVVPGREVPRGMVHSIDNFSNVDPICLLLCTKIESHALRHSDWERRCRPWWLWKAMFTH